MRWVWPWSDGDSGLLGQLTMSSDLPLLGLFLEMIAATFFFCAALAVIAFWVPFGWWRILAGGGAIVSFVLMTGFFGATKLIPMALDVVVLWAVVTDPLQLLMGITACGMIVSVSSSSTTPKTVRETARPDS